MQQMGQLISDLVILFVLIILLVWKKYHFKIMWKNEIKSIKKEFISMLYAALVAIILIIIIENCGWFAGIYIGLPLSVVIMSWIRRDDEMIQKFCVLLKGIYYIAVALYSIVQYYSKSEKLAEVAVGFTIALAIFESTAALHDWILKIKSKEK
mgnify:CR=1 FL=1